MCPGKIPESVSDIKCFTEVLNYYLPLSLSRITETKIVNIPTDSNPEGIAELFRTLNVDGYQAILTLGLRFYSKIERDITDLIRSRFDGLFCQVHDGSRLDNDPVDITFTFKNDDDRLITNPGWYRRHSGKNIYMGWAADPDINVPNQSLSDLRILVDHTNYGGNQIDLTKEILLKIKKFIDSDLWKSKYSSVSVRRFDSGQVIDVDFDSIDDIVEYDRRAIPLSEISIEHGKAHIFMVTHPESVGLVVLETSMAGALAVSPRGFIPKDRLDTVAHIEWEGEVCWDRILANINPAVSRSIALTNSWDQMAVNVIEELQSRLQK